MKLLEKTKIANRNYNVVCFKKTDFGREKRSCFGTNRDSHLLCI